MEEFVLALLKYLTTFLTPVQFLVVIGLIVVATVMGVKFVLKRKELGKLFGGGTSDLEEKSLKITEQHSEDLARLELIMRAEFAATSKSIQDLKEKFVEISILRHEIVDKEFSRLFLEVQNQSRDLEAYYGQSQDQRESILDANTRILSLQAKIETNVENIDAYIKAAIPEFRTYHREHGNDLRMLSRDLALVERSVALAINSGTAVKLR